MLQDIISTKCVPGAIIRVVHEKSGDLTGLKCDLAEQAHSTPFETFTMNTRVLYLLFSGSIISRPICGIQSTGGIFKLAWFHTLTTCIHDVSNDFCTPCQCPLKYGPHLTCIPAHPKITDEVNKTTLNRIMQ